MSIRLFPVALLSIASAVMLSACDTTEDDPARNPPMSPPSPAPTDTPLNPPPGNAAPQAGGAQSNSLNSALTRGNLVEDSQLEALPHAFALMAPTEGNEARGTISFLKSANNIAGVRVVVELTGLTPGPHGMHIHETGDCSAPDASSAGDHFNPHDMPHGARTAPERHTGDLGNVSANDSGVAEVDLEDSTIAFEGQDSVLGKAVIVHATGDDYTTQPSGDSGDPVACGVITLNEVTSLPPTGQ